MNQNKGVLFIFLLIIAGILSGCSVSTPVEPVSFETSKDFFRNGNTLSPEEENVIGRAVSAQILSKYRPVNNEHMNYYLSQIGSVLVSFSERPDTFAGYSFLILDTEEVNAMAAPGGYIFITRGMLKKAHDEDALAAIIAHEIVHVARGHGLQAIQQKHLGSISEIDGKFLSAIDCSGLSQQLSVAFQKAVNDVVEKLLSAGYSKDQEYEADAGASQILLKAGYDPKALLEIFKELSASNKQKGGWFDTHPSAEERKEVVESKITASTKASDGYAARKKRFFKNMP